ncbi:hypothetical protein IEE94_13985 [Yimella sp. cx-573]|nr:hypothetical protein [Yimella sp. cx-573]
MPVAIRYFVDAAVHEADLYVDGCEHQISAGDSIEIYVDRTNPNRFVSDRSDNASPMPQSVAIGALVIGIALFAAAVSGTARFMRIRRILRRAPWVTRDATVMKVQKRGTIPGSTKPADSHLVVALGSDAEPTLLKTAFTVLGHQTIAPTSTVIPLRTAHHGSSWVVARDVDSRPIAAREVRAAWLRDRARRELKTPASD